MEARAKDLTWERRQALRQRESTAILATIKTWLDTRPLQQVLPKSDFAEALRYLHNHWPALNVFVGDGRIPIDNNSVEQLMKQVATGRKAWLFVCNVSAGEQSARMRLCFLVDGKMCVGIDKDRLMARIDPEAYEAALSRKGCVPMDFTGRPMRGIVFVNPVGTEPRQDLRYWIELALEFNPRAVASRRASMKKKTIQKVLP